MPVEARKEAKVVKRLDSTMCLNTVVFWGGVAGRSVLKVIQSEKLCQKIASNSLIELWLKKNK